MASLRDIRSRIASVKNTQQITRAMKMVSAAKLRRAQENIVNLRPYSRALLSIIADIASTQRVSHPLLEKKADPKRVLMVVIASDRGLCGGFNANINKYTETYWKENRTSIEMDFLIVGRKAIDYFIKRGVKPVEAIMNLAKDVSYGMAAGVSEKLMAAFSNGKYDEVRLVYNEFKSAISQRVVTETLLPVSLESSTLEVQQGTQFSRDLIFEPKPEFIVDELLKKHFAVQVYRCMSESVAAEHAARMTAMENATKNAKDMINSLTLTYNNARQASITTELIEITSGSEALKG